MTKKVKLRGGGKSIQVLLIHRNDILGKNLFFLNMLENCASLYLYVSSIYPYLIIKRQYFCLFFSSGPFYWLNYPATHSLSAQMWPIRPQGPYRKKSARLSGYAPPLWPRLRARPELYQGMCYASPLHWLLIASLMTSPWRHDYTISSRFS